MIDLQPFCSTNKLRPSLHRPWSAGRWSIATNGHILVRVPRRDDIAENPSAPDIKGVVRALDGVTFRPLRNIDVPPPADSETECSKCDGRGTEHDCPQCTCECEACEGTGVAVPAESVSVGIGGVPFSAKYVRLLQCLPKIEVGADLKVREPMPFRFDDGGEGVLMPLFYALPTHIEEPAP
jgi:hypothetical protein